MERKIIEMLENESKKYIAELGAFNPGAISAEEEAMAWANAEASHAKWVEEKASKGYVWGSVVNNDPEKGPLTDPEMVPFASLSEETQNKNFLAVLGTIGILKNKGFGFMSKKDLCRAIAKEIHDNWSRIQIQNGFVWDIKTDKQNKRHRDLLSFEILEKYFPEDVSYDMREAEALLDNMWAAGFVLVGFMH